MIRPKAAPVYAPIDLKLGIKSSLPSVKPTLALLFILWEQSGRPAELEYCIQLENSLRLRPDIETSILSEAHRIGMTESDERLRTILAGNLMLKSQLEALIVALELIWKVAKIRFTGDRVNGAERTGGLRFPKKLFFTSNMDLFASVIAGNRDAYMQVLFSWLGVDLAINTQAEDELIRFLTVISEGAYYKLVDGDNDVIFNMESLYSAILDGGEPVDISGDAEAKGPLRILKSALTENLFSNIHTQSNKVTPANRQELQEYLSRVATFHELNVVPSGETPPIPSEESENEQEDTPEGLVGDINFLTGFNSAFERNRITFGAPGTGKSHRLNDDRQQLLREGGSYERVTFHPEYTYSQFVGCYKPVTDEHGNIQYDYVPGPFMRVLVAALKSGRTESPQPHLLLIEEINRAKVAAVFGEVFQLLDRGDSGASEYEIHATEDIKKYLISELGSTPESIRIPDNMFIWATMNSADQGVFPMDTAFKRRWNFEYIGINENDSEVGGIVTLGRGDHAMDVEWNQLRKAINETLAVDFNVNEDKLLGPYFLGQRVFAYDDEHRMLNPDKFIAAFKSKVIMYLYEDAAKPVRKRLFENCDNSRYSSVCDAFDERGIEIFGASFLEKYRSHEV